MKDYLFCNNVTDENFFVECENFKKAWEIVKENFGEDCHDFIDYCGWCTVEEADILGYDTY